MKVAIAGAGIGGLAAACLMHDTGHDVTVFDKFDTPRPVGSGLVIQPVGQAVLHRIGARTAAVNQGAPIHRMSGQNERGRHVLDVSYGIKNDGVFGLGIHRSSLFDVLFDAVKSRDIPVIASFEVAQRDDQQLIAQGGQRSERFDLIIDALGAGSTLSPLKAKPLPFGAVWGTVDWPDTELPHDQLSQHYTAARHMIGVMPCGMGRAAVFWSLPRDAHQAFRTMGLDAWKKQAVDMWPAFAPFAAQITNLDQLTFAAYSHGSLSRMWSTGMAHIGDAAHRASPQLGQGANMALLDAAALSHACTLAQGNDALKLYRTMRWRHIAVYQIMSRVFTPMYQSQSPLPPMIRDTVLFPLSRAPLVPRILTHLVRGDLIRPLGRIRRR